MSDTQGSDPDNPFDAKVALVVGQADLQYAGLAG